MKIASLFPAFAAAIAVTGLTVFATAADEDIYLYKDAEPPRVEIEQDQAMPANGEEVRTNGEAMNGEAQPFDTTTNILLPAPRPVEEPLYGNGEVNGEAGIEINGDTEVRVNGEVQEEPLSEWPRYPYGQYRFGENGQTNGELNGEVKTEPCPEKEHKQMNGDMEYRNGENGEWQEVETNGEETVTPYTDEEMQYEDRDGENGDGGWYDSNGEESEYLRNRTGHRWGWPGRK